MTPEDKFVQACEEGLLPIVEAMVEEGFDPAWYNYKGFRMGMIHNHLDILKYLYSVHGPYWIYNKSVWGKNYPRHVIHEIKYIKLNPEVANWLSTLPH